MQELDKTTRLSSGSSTPNASDDVLITIFDADLPPRTLHLASYGKSVLSFGRSAANDIVLHSPLVSREHGRLRLSNGQWIMEDRALFGDKPSENGLLYNNASILSRPLCEGDLVRIDDGVETVSAGVLFVVSAAASETHWQTLALRGEREIGIGRDASCAIVLKHVSVSKRHARVVLSNMRKERS